MKNILTAINVLIFSFLVFFNSTSLADTQVIGLVINQSSIDDLNNLYKTEKRGDLGYEIDVSQIPIKGIREAGVVIFENKVKVVSLKFNNSRYLYLEDLLKSKYKLIRNEDDVFNSTMATFENDGDMIFLKDNGGVDLDLVYVDKEYNILVNKSFKKRAEKERNKDLNNL